MKKRGIHMAITILLLLPFYAVANFYIFELIDAMGLSSKADNAGKLIVLFMRYWTGIPSLLMIVAGSMLLGSVLTFYHPIKRWQRVFSITVACVYTLLFYPYVRFSGYSWLLGEWFAYIVPLILPLICILSTLYRPVRYMTAIVYGLGMLWGLIICIVDYVHGGRGFGFIAGCMLIPSSLLLRNWLCPNSRIASVAAVMVFGWSVYMVESILIRYLILKGSILGGYSILYIFAILALPLSLVCLIIDTVMVFLSHRKAAIPAAPGDPPAPAEE